MEVQHTLVGQESWVVGQESWVVVDQYILVEEGHYKLEVVHLCLGVEAQWQWEVGQQDLKVGRYIQGQELSKQVEVALNSLMVGPQTLEVVAD